MLLVGTKNVLTQTVLTDGIILLGNVYRRFCKKNTCGIGAFNVDSNSITLQHKGIYHITATLIVSGSVAGNVTVDLIANGNISQPLTFASETITTATTEVRTMVLDYYILVDSACVLGQTATTPVSLSLVNTGVGAIISNVVFNVEKVV